MNIIQKRRPPFAKIDCQSLLEQDGAFSGWLRKNNNVRKKWSKHFVVLYKGHVYTFKNETSMNHMDTFSLYGYISVDGVEECDEKEKLWIFKIVNSEGSSKSFAAASRNELRSWCERFLYEIDFENNVEMPEKIYRPKAIPHRNAFDNVSHLPMQGHSSVICLQNKLVCRDTVYGISGGRPPLNPHTERALPSVPRRQPTPDSTHFAKRDSYSVNDQDCQDPEDVHYYNIKEDVCGFLLSSVTLNDKELENDGYDECEVLYVNVPGDTYRVIAVKAYSAKYSNHLSFEKDDIFVVVNRASDSWLVGDKNGQKGIFPEECIQRLCPADGYASLQDDSAPVQDYDKLSVPINDEARTELEVRKTQDYLNDKQESLFNVIAVNSYKARQEPELNFNKGTKFEVVGCISDQWLIGELHGKRGAFPAECIKILNQPLSEVKSDAEKDNKKERPKRDTKSLYSVIALKSYTSTMDEELSFKKDDKFRVVGKETDRWLIGEINGRKGLFPSEYVKKVNLSQNYKPHDTAV
ncbi:unnamed protein product [Mytilus coruscus]|uniref:Uncharacterized protein n=1 Tax=Mytilus coruscus TaxID=42192 RepID=A0A6J8F3K9_MYTCO|nr:unnamed protein product [Mytilus coruscus]